MKTKLTTLILILHIGLMTAQFAPKQRDYSYFTIGSSTAKIPHTNKLTPNILLQAGITHSIFDVSINYEYVELTPNYHSYYGQVQILPFQDLYGFEMLTGVKFGRAIRGAAAYRYAGVQGEIRHVVWGRLFLALQVDYDYRGDIRYWWGEDYMVYSVHFKIGVRL